MGLLDRLLGRGRKATAGLKDAVEGAIENDKPAPASEATAEPHDDDHEHDPDHPHDHSH